MIFKMTFLSYIYVCVCFFKYFACLIHEVVFYVHYFTNVETRTTTKRENCFFRNLFDTSKEFDIVQLLQIGKSSNDYVKTFRIILGSSSVSKEVFKGYKYTLNPMKLQIPLQMMVFLYDPLFGSAQRWDSMTKGR